MVSVLVAGIVVKDMPCFIAGIILRLFTLQALEILGTGYVCRSHKSTFVVGNTLLSELRLQQPRQLAGLLWCLGEAGLLAVSSNYWSLTRSNIQG